MRSLVWALSAAIAGCGSSGSSAAVDATAPDGGMGPEADGAEEADVAQAAEGSTVVDAPDATPCPVMLAATKTFQVPSAPFPGTNHPDVLVRVPPGFDACNRPGLVVFFHGFDNCVTNVAGSVDSACSPDGGVRPAAHLSDQLDQAHVNALLFAVQLAFDAPTSDPGQLATAGDFQTLVHDVFAALSPSLGRPLAPADLDRIVVASASGGYGAAAAVLAQGGLGLREVDLYDSLLGDTVTFAGWIQSNAPRFAPARSDGLRFVDLYTAGGGTETQSLALAATANAALADAGLTGALSDQRDGGGLVLTAPIVFALTPVAHDDVPRSDFGTVLGAAGFAPL
jgi:hypothetical protein